jgi:hypothetical protein
MPRLVICLDVESNIECGVEIRLGGVDEECSSGKEKDSIRRRWYKIHTGPLLLSPATRLRTA